MKEDYKIIKKLGKGGMSRVFLAVDRRIARKWTIKEITCDEKEYIFKSVYREVSLLKKIKNDRIAKIVDIYTDKNKVCLVMEYIEGTTLAEICRKRPEFAERMRDKWILEIAEILNELHSSSPPVIYRDLKPSNIIVKSDGKLCLIDFGAAKIRSLDSKDLYPTGTYKYSAPEQIEGYTDELTDIYSFGKTIEQLVGKDIFLNRIVDKCIEDDRRKRPQNVRSIIKDLRLYLICKRYCGYVLLFICLTIMTAFVLIGKYKVRRAEAEKYHNYLTQEKLEKLEGTAPQDLNENIMEMEKYSETCSREEGELIKYKCAVKALIELYDYEHATRLFEGVDTEEYPEVKYLKIISEELSKFSDKADGLYEILTEYKKYIDECESVKRKENLVYIARLLILEAERADSIDGNIIKEILEIADEIETYDKSEGYDLKYIAYGMAEDGKNICRYGEKWLENADIMRNVDMTIKRCMEVAEIYRINSENEKAVNILEKAEQLFPDENAELYIEHIKVLQGMGADDETSRALYLRALRTKNADESKEQLERIINKR